MNEENARYIVHTPDGDITFPCEGKYYSDEVYYFVHVKNDEDRAVIQITDNQSDSSYGKDGFMYMWGESRTISSEEYIIDYEAAELERAMLRHDYIYSSLSEAIRKDNLPISTSFDRIKESLWKYLEADYWFCNQIEDIFEDDEIELCLDSMRQLIPEQFAWPVYTPAV